MVHSVYRKQSIENSAQNIRHQVDIEFEGSRYPKRPTDPIHRPKPSGGTRQDFEKGGGQKKMLGRGKIKFVWTS